MQATLAFGWDYAALVRRVAILEDLLAQQQVGMEPLDSGMTNGASLSSPPARERSRTNGAAVPFSEAATIGSIRA
jgi:hypothetical protein